MKRDIFEELNEEQINEINKEVAIAMEKTKVVCNWDNENEKDKNYYPCLTTFCKDCKHNENR